MTTLNLDRDDLSGQTIKGYELRERIGVGGFGAVYRAYQPMIDREVAIKIILPKFSNLPDFIRRFDAEAHLVARLEHLHIVPLYDYWREPDGAFLVMRFLRGGSLRSLLKKGPLPLDETSKLLDQISGALAVAHRNGVVHRDLKPDNILLDEEENAYLADFGIAIDAAASEESTDIDAVIGSPGYLSPEQVRSVPVTSQADLYSLGVMMYEMLAGEHPFVGLPPTTMLVKHLTELLPSLTLKRPDLPEMMDDIIQRATAKEPEDRYSDALTMAAAFRQAIIFSEGHAPLQGMIHVPTNLSVTEEMTPISVPHVFQNPYKGLRAFQEADAEDFFGRDALTDHLLSKLREGMLTRFLAVVGPSGSGKSSVVKAGVVPALRHGEITGSENWFYVEMVPGTEPLEELAAALLRVSVNPPDDLLAVLRKDEYGLLNVLSRILPGEDDLLLLVDQFEEVFTLVTDEAERAHFLKSLYVAVTAPHSRLRLIVTLRADFYDRPLHYAEFGELVRRRTEVVLPLNVEELRQAITAPARRVGLTLQPELVEGIVNDVKDQIGMLPLLQYALTELFEWQIDYTLTLSAYDTIGRVTGALARRAEELFSDLDEQQQEMARQMFLRLVTLGEGTEDTRRRVEQYELMSVGQGMADVIGVFGKYRLLTFDREPATRAPTVEVAHEALIREWTRLREWLDASREDLRLQRRIAQAATEWEAAEHDPSYLATGVRLEQLVAWADETSLALNQHESEYLAASVAQRQALATEEQARAAHEALLEKRSRNFLRSLVGVMLVALIIASGLSVLAITRGRQAQDARLAAESNAEQAQSLALASSAQLSLSNNNSELAVALAMAARRADLPLVQRTLFETVYYPGINRRMTHDGEVFAVAYSPDGRHALSGASDNTLILWDLNRGEAVRSFEGHENWVRSAAFSPDGQRAVSGADDQTVIIWDVNTGEIINRLRGHRNAVRSVAWSPDGRFILSGSDDTDIIQWNADDGRIVQRLVQSAAPVRSVAWSPDSAFIVSGGGDGILMLWDIRTGVVVQTFEGHTDAVWSVAYSPNGTQLLSGSVDRTVRLWNVETGNAIRRFTGHSDWVVSVAFSRDGRTAISGAEDNRVILWNVATGEAVRVFEGHGGEVSSVAFSPDDFHALSGARDGSVILWDTQPGDLLKWLDTHDDWVNAVAFSTSGQTMLTGSSDGTMILWDGVTGEQIRRFSGHNAPIWAVAFSPDGTLALSGSDDTTMILWDVMTGRPVRQFRGHGEWVDAVEFSPDGRTALSGSGDYTLILWDVETGALIRRFNGHDGEISHLAFHPNGRRAISASNDGTLIVWDVETGELLRRLQGHDDEVTSVAFSADGNYAVSGSNDRTAIVWDVSEAGIAGTQPNMILHRFREHTSAVLGVAFSPDGNAVVSASSDSSLIRWSLATGAALNRFTAHRQPVTSAAFSPDGTRLISGSYDSSAVLWRIDSFEEMMAWAYDNRYIRELTCRERDQYGYEPACDASGMFPTRTPFHTAVPSLTPVASATPDLAQITTTPSATVTLTLTPLPTPTLTPIPRAITLGQYRGEIVVGDREAWLYNGRAGEVLMIAAYADNPTNDTDLAQSRSRGLLDTLLIVRGPDGEIIAEADDIRTSVTDSRIDELALPVDGPYVIEVHSYGDQLAGAYRLIVQAVRE